MWEWRRRESNPGPEAVALGVYVCIPSYLISARGMREGTPSPGLAIVDLVLRRQAFSEDQPVC